MDAASNTEMQSTATSNARRKTDPAWDHFAHSVEQGKHVYTCLYCGKKYKGGGIFRMKHHLACKKGQIGPCKNVPYDVCAKMRGILYEMEKEKGRRKTISSSRYDDEAFEDDRPMEEVEEVQEIPSLTKKQSQAQDKGKRKVGVEQSDNFLAKRTTPGSQPSIMSALASQNAVRRAHMAIARWLYDCGIPFSAVQSPYFQLALDAIIAVGPGYKAPSYHELRGTLLRDCKKECQLLVDSYRRNWANTGCTIMADSWTDQTQRTLINFLVYCSAGISFFKSIDASDMVKDPKALFNMFSEVIEWVGPANVVHVVTDGAANYFSTGKLIHEKYESIYWSPCAALCLNNLLKDIGSMPHVSNLVSRASKVTAFVYNHMIFLSWLRRRPGWKEIVRPGATRFATTFIILKSIYDHKHDLQALVLDKHFTSHKLGKTASGKNVGITVMDNQFWKDCLLIVKITAPLIRLLRIVDAEEKPSLGYVYEGMQRAINAIKKTFGNKKKLYKPYTDLIEFQLDKHLRCDLHVAAYFFNPAYFYDENLFEKPEVMHGLLNLLEAKSICDEPLKAVQEIQLYREHIGSFSRKTALSLCKTMLPDEWWRLFGHSAPHLQKIAIRILSQTAACTGCEWNWSFFERIHSKKRNRLEHQRLIDHMFVAYNLRLKNRLYHKKKTYDPIDYECIDKLDCWVVEEEATPEFDNDEVEDFIYDETAIPILGESSRDGENEDEMNVQDEPSIEGDTSSNASEGDVNLGPIDAHDLKDMYGF